MGRQLKQCGADLRARWLHFNRELKFREDVPLADIIVAFATPAVLFIKESYPALVALPSTHIWLMIFTAVLEAKTHPANEANEAFQAIRERFGITVD